MDQILICNGFKCGNLYVPAFTVRQGEYLVLNFPGILDFAEEKLVRKILTGEEKVDSVKLFESFVSVSNDINIPFFAKIVSLKVLSFLRRKTGLPDEQIKSLLKSTGINPSANIYTLGFGERILVGLIAGYSKSTNIILNSSGLDYTSIELVKETALQILKKGTLIEMNYESSKGRIYIIDDEQVVKRRTVDVQNSDLDE